MEAASAPARLEPAVKDLLDTLQLPLTLLRRDRDVVNLVAVEVGDALDARQLLELGDRRDADNL
jgi:hypothetical protein